MSSARPTQMFLRLLPMWAVVVVSIVAPVGRLWGQETRRPPLTSSTRVITSGYTLTPSRAEEIGADRRAKNPRRPVDPIEQGNHQLAVNIASRAQQTYARALRLEETENFLIFHTYGLSSDRPTGVFAERSLAVLSHLLRRPVEQAPWQGKCPIFLFAQDAEYRQFLREANQDPANPLPEGYALTMGSLRYICAGPPETRVMGLESLAYQITRSYMEGFLPGQTKSWMVEGLSHLIAARVTPGTTLDKAYRQAAKRALEPPPAPVPAQQPTPPLPAAAAQRRLAAPLPPVPPPPAPRVEPPSPPAPPTPRPDPIATLLDSGPSSADEKLLAYGVVRYLSAISSGDLAKFYSLLHQKKTCAEALAGSFRLTTQQLAQEWREAALRETVRD